MKSLRFYFLSFLSIGLICGCSSSSSAPTPPPPPAQDLSYLSSPTDNIRKWLTEDQLLAATYAQPTPIHNDYFLPIGQSNEAITPFSGRLQLTTFKGKKKMNGNVSNLIFPDVDLEFVSHNGILIPINRQFLRARNTATYDLIIDPGKVWSEPSDNGWSRASFPFILVYKNANQSHNGVATFLYKDQSVSYFRFQITQETAAWEIFDGWGQLNALYTPIEAATYTNIINDFQIELAQRFPTASWDDLESSTTENITQYMQIGVAKSEVTTSGIIVDHVLYQRPSYTRYGLFPYPKWMRSGVFSATKSMAGSIALLRLAKIYGEEVFDALIKDYLPVTSNHEGWENVTFKDCLNMATGIGDLKPTDIYAVFADEDQPKMEQWHFADSLQDKLSISFEYGNLPWEPGLHFRYNTTHTFVLSAAMDAYLKEKEGSQANLWDMVMEDVFKPIGIFHAPMMHTIETDQSRGVPWIGVGLYPTTDDIAKISFLLQNLGEFQGQQLLHREKTKLALFQTSDQGLRTYIDTIDGQGKYMLSFWTLPYKQNDCFAQVPFMSGYGGNSIVLLPNGISVFSLADNLYNDVDNLINAGLTIRDLCVN